MRFDLTDENMLNGVEIEPKGDSPISMSSHLVKAVDFIPWLIGIAMQTAFGLHERAICQPLVVSAA